MKKTLFLFLILTLLTGLSWSMGDQDQESPELIMVSIPPQKFLLEQLTGGSIEVASLLTALDNPHNFQPKPSQIRKLSQASIYIASGIGLEDSFLPDLQKTLSHIQIINSARDVSLRRLEDHHHDDDDDEAPEKDDTGEHRDPHFWTSPERMLETLPLIEAALLETFPEQEEMLRARYIQTESRLKEMHLEMTRQLAPYKGRILFVYHPTLGYFCDSYGLIQEAVETGGKEPSPRQMQKIIEEARSDQVKLMLVQPQFSRTAAETIASSIGGRVESYNMLDYDWIENLRRLASLVEESYQQESP